MRSSSSTLRRLSLFVGAVVVAAAWFSWLRPTALGGDAAYVVVQGHSMEPTYEDGDLVLVREESHYRHGDVIAFRAGGTFDDATRIIHRIVGDAGDGAFKTQGDNRDSVDPWEPRPHDIIGKAVLHIPMAGKAVGFLTQPATFAALGGVAVVVGGGRRRRRRRLPHPNHRQDERLVIPADPPVTRSTRQAATSGTSRRGRMTHPRWAFVGLIASALLAAPVLAVAWSALRAPDSTQRVDHIGQLDYGIGLDYRFTGPASAVYPSGVVTTTHNAAGAVAPTDPLYSRLLDRLAVEIAFRAEEEGADSLTGTYTVDVTVETPGGWSTTIAAVEPTGFDGTAVETVDVDLRAVAAQVADVATLTGVGGDAYAIKVTPRIHLDGASAAGQVQEQLTAPMTFAVENNLITATALETSEQQELTRSVAERATYSIGPLDLGTQAARGLVGGLALVLVAAIAWFASVLFGGVGLGEPERIAARYRSQIVDVSAAAAPPGPVVMVSAIDELARIAKVEQTVIVHEDLGDGAHRYRVFLGTVTYEYEAAPEDAGGVTDQVAAGTDETEG